MQNLISKKYGSFAEFVPDSVPGLRMTLSSPTADETCCVTDEKCDNVGGDNR